jgi:lysophospholipid acyltransferase (LPLAT)-like uncharacterized protein
MLNRVLKSEMAHRVAAAALGAYLSFALRTTRWVLDGGENLTPLVGAPGVIAAFWHECLPVMPALWMRFRAADPSRDVKVLISRHRDGRLIADVMRTMDIGVIHGSSAREGKGSRGGVAGLRALIAALKAGATVVITPDGPRGPPRVAAGGVAQLAALSNLPILPCAGWLRHHVRLKSWDRMVVPLPFGRGVLVCLPPIAVGRGAVTEATVTLAAALTQAVDRAVLLCR